MGKWKYKIVDSKDVPGRGIFKRKARTDIEGYLNDLGKDGWEIINLDFRELDNRFEFSGVAKKEVIACNVGA